MLDPTDWSLIDRYFAGELGEIESAQVRQWLAVHPNGAKVLAQVRRELDAAPSVGALIEQKATASWDQLAHRMAESSRPAKDTSSHDSSVAKNLSNRSKQLRRFGTQALHERLFTALRSPIPYVVAGMAVVALTTLLTGRTSLSGPQREYVTGNGERANIRLTDGTSVTLGAASRLRYQPFARGSRNVYVDGEAHFTVAPKLSSPFVVYTGHAATQVLGTTFTVRQYPGDSVTQVIVTDGKVALRPRSAASGTGVTLTHGDLGRLDAAGLATVAHGVNPEEYAGWMHGTLTFRDTQLRDVISDMERWYDVQIVLSDPALASLAITGKLTARSSDEAISRLADVTNLHFARNGRIVTLSPERRSPHAQ